MDPKIEKREAFELLGVQVRCKPEETDFSAIWDQQYMPRHAEVAPHSTDGAWYGASFCGGEDGIDYLAGMAVHAAAKVPDGLVRRAVPAATYAVFECTIATIGRTYGYVYGEWLPGAPYERDEAAADFEYFPPGTASDESPAFIYVPVREEVAP